MMCIDCKRFHGKQEPKRVYGKNPKGCECPIGIICPDLAGDDSERVERNLSDLSYRADLMGFNSG